MSEYHLFRKSVKSKGKTVHRWYYYYDDLFLGKRVQKVCKGCKTQMEAFAFISSLKPIIHKKSLTINEVAKNMFLPFSDHIKRLEQLGKKISLKTMRDNRCYCELICKIFGNIEFEKLNAKDVVNYLMNLEKSGSWKNNFIQTLRKIYNEAQWYSNSPITTPSFPTFSRNSKKADIFTTEELSLLFDSSIWENEREYILFFVTATCGLRLGEARALRPCQFSFKQNSLLIDGFCLANGTRTNYNKKGTDEDKKLRVTPVPSFTINLVKNYIQLNKISDDDFIFNRGKGIPLRQEYLESVFRRMINKAGIIVGSRKLVPHSLRYTYVTKMRQVVSADQVQKIVGHTTIEMTEYYTRAAIPEMIDAMKNIIPLADKVFENIG